MSRNTDPQTVEASRVYTIHPVDIQGNVNYAFHPSHPQAPPPKYEDVMSGNYTVSTSSQQMPPTGVIVVAAPKATKSQKILGMVFLLAFAVVFIVTLSKILKAR